MVGTRINQRGYTRYSWIFLRKSWYGDIGLEIKKKNTISRLLRLNFGGLGSAEQRLVGRQLWRYARVPSSSFVRFRELTSPRPHIHVHAHAHACTAIFRIRTNDCASVRMFGCRPAVECCRCQWWRIVRRTVWRSRSRVWVCVGVRAREILPLLQLYK